MPIKPFCNSNKSHQCKKIIFIKNSKVLWLHLESIDSTMDYAMKIIHNGIEPWTVISADEQSSGRGTHGRTWYSPAGKGFWMSVILPPPQKAGYLDNLSVFAAQALVRSFREFTDIEFVIKPPNDVITRGRKIAGILFESVSCGQDVSSVILGMGVNLRQSVRDFECEGLNEATSFRIETGDVPETERFLKTFLCHFKPLYDTSVLKIRKQ